MKTGFVPGVDMAIVYYATIGSWEGPLVRFTFRNQEIDVVDILGDNVSGTVTGAAALSKAVERTRTEWRVKIIFKMLKFKRSKNKLEKLEG